jgi:hypothetical protein
MVPVSVRIGENDGAANVRIEVIGYEHPEIAEPAGMDLLRCRVHANAPPVNAPFPLSIRVEEFLALRDYLREINSGNGPEGSFEVADGLLNIAFAPSRRGPVLVAVQLKSIESSHVRLEYLVTLEPESITRAISDLAALETSVRQ